MKQSISLTTDAIIFAQHASEYYVLLIQRKNQPFKHHWALPGGFVENNELLIEACKRELEEETSLQVDAKHLQFVGVFDQLQRDPRGRNITLAYAAEIWQLQEVKAKDDAKNATWVKLTNCKNEDLAFDHFQIIQAACTLMNIDFI